MNPVLARRAARAAHETLISALRDLEKAEQNAVLRFADILHEKHYRHLGFASIWHYGLQGLGFSRAKTGHFVRLAKDVKRLPALAQALEKNEIEWTKAREVGRVATPENQKEWIDRAKRKSRLELEREVRQVRKRAKAPRAAESKQSSLVPGDELPKGDPPVRVSFELTPLQLAEFEKLLEKLPGKSRSELLLAGLAELVRKKKSPRGDSPPIQVVVHRCDTCEKTSVPTNRGDLTVASAMAVAATCDAVQFEPHARSHSRIPKKLRQRVLARDGHRCRVCRGTRYVEVHHRHKQSEGGAHTLENCMTLCRACHVNLHREEELLERGIAIGRETLATG